MGPRLKQPRRPQPRGLEALKVSVANLDEKVEKLLHYLEGNGNPGLLHRMTVLEESQKPMAADISEARLAIKDLTKAVETQNAAFSGQTAMLSSSLATLTSLVTAHVKPDNPQHKTLLQQFQNRPIQVMLAVLVTFTFLHAAEPWLNQVIGYLKGLLF
jgi:hypothetical protein